jgi:hypothetical protein
MSATTCGSPRPFSQVLARGPDRAELSGVIALSPGMPGGLLKYLAAITYSAWVGVTRRRDRGLRAL